MNVLDRLKRGLVASCQAYPSEPMRDPVTMRRVAQACIEGGAVAIRAQGIADLRAIRAVTELPVIGLWKDGRDGVFITPTVGHAVAVARTGCEVVAVDATRRPRPDGRPLRESFEAVHAEGALVMADCSSFDDAVAAVAVGADLVGTTLSGYTPDTVSAPGHPAGPDLVLVARLALELDVPVLAEGRIHTPAQARAALDAGAHAVVVGTAITHPTSITSWFVEALTAAGPAADG